MAAMGLLMLVCLGVVVIRTALPVWVLLLGVSTAFAGLGLGLGQFDAGVLRAMPARLVGLLEHDLLQALPLYVLDRKSVV